MLGDIIPTDISRSQNLGQLLEKTYDCLQSGWNSPEALENSLNDLILGLVQSKRTTSSARWQEVARQCLEHPLTGLIRQDPFTYRAASKPRGYAGDAVMLDYIYSREEQSCPTGQVSELGQRLFDYTTDIPAAAAVRHRRCEISRLVNELTEQIHRPDILSIAAGHLREAAITSALHEGRVGRYVALDADQESLQEVDRCYGHLGVETVPSDVRKLIRGSLNLGSYDFVYTTGLFDYLRQPIGRRLVKNMFEMVRPGGRLLVANFHHGIRDVGYMESYMEWSLIYRDRYEMMDLTALLPHGQLGEIQTFMEENENVIFLSVEKK